MNKVVITGMGVVSPIACDVESFWTACLNNQSNVQFIPDQWKKYSKYKSNIWSPLPEIDFISQGFNRVEIMQRDPISLLAIMAANEALQQSGIDCTPFNGNNLQCKLQGIDPDKSGVFIGTGTGGANTLHNHIAHQILDQTTKLLAESDVEPTLINRFLFPRKFNPFCVSMFMQNSVSASIGLKYSLHGMNRTISQACSSGTTAIGAGYQAIKSGQMDFAICGGAEYLYDEYGAIFKGFDTARTLAISLDDIELANRPFDRDRSGFLLSQGGAGILILEQESTAIKRGANILAYVSGFSETFDAHSMMNINSDGIQIKRMIHQTLNDAQLQLADIDYINTHGTGTKLNDEVESKMIDELFTNKPIINSSKSLLGHSIGACGAFEAIISTMSLKHQTTHQCKNLQNPIRDLNFVTKVQKQNIRHVLSESFAFGGHNSALIFSKY